MFRSLLLLLPGGIAVAAAAANTGANTPTFHKDVLPVLQRNCQECHRAGEAGPMPFTSYKESRPWAKAIKQAVQKGSMPPWFADPKHGKFANERRLTEQEMATLVTWADNGAPEGNPKDAPAPRKFVDGWLIGQPDKVIPMPSAFQIPASGTVDYQYMILPTGLTEDAWIEKAELRPGNRAVNHHVIAFIRPASSKWFRDEKPGEFFVPKKVERGEKRTSEDGAGDPMVELLVGYAPGLQPIESPAGSAKRLPKGSDIVLQLHYTTNGKPAEDLSKVGLIFAKNPPVYRQLTMNATNNRFVIPANASAHEVKSSITLQEEVGLIWLMPHMHLRGKDFVYTAVYPAGEREVLLNVPRYDFNWQLGYQYAKPKILPKGTRIECVAHFDNSKNNAANPNSETEVRWGDQSWEEMMIGWFDVAIQPQMDPMDIYRPKPGGAAAASKKPAD